ncbi:MAG: hypothetical protein PHV59_05975 [Victivallales bacterium]|nr:hypothetical protein [Victivallales bacterium]
MNEELMAEERESEFSWSFSRNALFDFCPRAYFYHYYGSRGGFEPYSDNELLYQLKHLQTLRLWINGVVTEALRELFHDNSAAFNIHHAAKKNFRRGVRSLTLREWRYDPKQLNLAELYYGKMEINELIEAGAELLEAALDSLTENSLVNYLCGIPFLDRKLVEFPAAAYLGEIKFWISPALLWQEDDLLKFLCLSFESPDKTRKRHLAALHKFYAFNALRIAPERVVTLDFCLLNGETTFVRGGEINVSETVGLITESCAAMSAFLTDRQTAVEGNFPENPEHCTQCRFQKYCGK